MELLYVGSGPISNFHVPALLEAGFIFKKVATTKNSDRCKKFCERYNLDKCYQKEGYKYAINHEKFDCAVIAVDTKVTPSVLEDLIKLRIPILVEKPLGWHPNQLKKIKDNYKELTDNILVAYNRRFYDGVNQVKDFIQNNKNGIIKLSIPDSIATMRQFLVNGCHMVDLLTYICSNLKIQYKKCVFDAGNNIRTLVAVAEGDNEWQILIDSKPMAPANFEISASTNKQVYKLKPIEILEVFDSMKIIDPSDDIPIRRYVPELKKKYIEEAKFKPGFLRQSKAFMKFCKSGEMSKGTTTFNDAIKTLELCHYLLEGKNLSFEDYINL